jgi:hypothetical protein
MRRHLGFNLPVLLSEREDQNVIRGRVRACCCTHIAGGVNSNPLKLFASLVVTRNNCLQIFEAKSRQLLYSVKSL